MRTDEKDQRLVRTEMMAMTYDFNTETLLVLIDCCYLAVCSRNHNSSIVFNNI